MSAHSPNRSWFPSICSADAELWPCAHERQQRARTSRMHTNYARRQR